MSSLPRWRGKLFAVGLSLLIIGTIAFGIENLLWRRQWIQHAYGQMAIWHETGLLVAIVSLALLLFGTGWKRWVLAGCALIELYLWFSGLAFLVQMT